MKWLPIKHREVQSEHFGKRGMSLHGSALLVNRGAYTHGFQLPAVSDCDKERAYPWQMLYYLDALEGVDEQSAATVVCIVDSLMARWRTMFPHAKTVSLQAVRVPWLGCARLQFLKCACLRAAGQCRVVHRSDLVHHATTHCALEWFQTDVLRSQ
jgi:hypothetical protein